MSAVNPLPQSEPVERRSHEPSMEEILASIRRIIADDQSLPGRVQFPSMDPAPSPSQPLRVERAPEPVDSSSAAPVATAAEAPHVPVESAPSEIGLAHGPISAPQFAMPHGPLGGDEPSVARQAVASPADQPVEPEVETFVTEPPRFDPPQTTPSAHAELLASAGHEPIVETLDEPTAFDAGSQAEVQAPAGAAPSGALEGSPLFSTATNSSVSEAFNMLAASRLADNSDELMTLAREMIRPLLRTWIDDNLPSMVERLVRAEIERVARGGR